MNGRITNIQTFSLHDGPGIRTTVFFAGCNLSCKWCHNPEAMLNTPKIMFIKEKCSGCGRCAAACPAGAISSGIAAILRERCIACGACAGVCPSGAVTLSSREISDLQLADEILQDTEIFEHTGGGVTFSGGEPFLQPDFLASVLKIMRGKGIHTAIETAADVPYEIILPLIGKIDLVICDLKAVDEKLHIEGTGNSNRRILENITRLGSDAKKLWVRIPLIPGFNDEKPELSAIGRFLAGMKHEKWELMPYHRLGESKYTQLGLDREPDGFTPPDDEQIRIARSLIVHSI